MLSLSKCERGSALEAVLTQALHEKTRKVERPEVGAEFLDGGRRQESSPTSRAAGSDAIRRSSVRVSSPARA